MLPHFAASPIKARFGFFTADSATQNMDRYPHITHGIMGFLHKNNRDPTWSRLAVYTENNIRYADPRSRLRIAGHAYSILRHDLIFRHVKLERFQADAFVNSLIAGGMTQSQTEEMMREMEDDGLHETYGNEYIHFVGMMLMALLQVRSA
jgi:hypothetical protein